MNKRQLKQYIRSYVSPVVQYGAHLYGLGPKSRLQKILLLQKKNSDSSTTSSLGQCHRKIQGIQDWNTNGTSPL